jgi:hypothetical protein
MFSGIITWLNHQPLLVKIWLWPIPTIWIFLTVIAVLAVLYFIKNGFGNHTNSQRIILGLVFLAIGYFLILIWPVTIAGIILYLILS